MKIKNKLWLYFLPAVASVATLSMIACSTESTPADPSPAKPADPAKPNDPAKPGDANKTYTDEELRAALAQLKVNAKLKDGKALTDLYPSQVLAANVELTLEGSLSDQFNVELIGIPQEADKLNNVTGIITITYKITAKINASIIKEDALNLTGLKNHPSGQPQNPFGNNYFTPKNSLDLDDDDDFKKYLNSDYKTRFDIDNANYVTALIEQITRLDKNQPLNDNPGNLSDAQLQENDQKAKANFQDTYKNSALKRFSLPGYDQNGKVAGLWINENPDQALGPSWFDEKADKRLTTGLARTLPNEKYKKAALQTFSIGITNTDKKKGFSRGTIWIMDYQLNDNGYPTKFYFGTNLHVAQALSLKDDPNYPNQYNPANATNSIQLVRLNTDAGVRTTFKTTQTDVNFTTWNFDSSAVKTVFNALNFLKSAPKDYITNTKPEYLNSQEMIDFAVIEIDFEKVQLNNLTARKGTTTNGQALTYTSAQELAKDITNGYADSKESQVKFLGNSFYKDYRQIANPIWRSKDDIYLDYLANNKDQVDKIKSLYAVGYPSSQFDSSLDQYADPGDKNDAAKFHVSLWTNGRGNWYNYNTSQWEGTYSEDPLNEGKKWSPADRGNFLSNTIGKNNFTDKPGVFDILITGPKAGVESKEENSDLFVYEIKDPTGKSGSKRIDEFENDPKVDPNFNNHYLKYGLNYMLRHYSPGGGASGTSVRTDDNEIVGVVYVSYQFAGVTLVAALRSEGINYNGYYGKYNMAAYDLIYGGAPDQRMSYRQALEHLYKNKDIKTALFPKGLAEEQIPAQYKFSQTSAVPANQANDTPKSK